MGRNDLFYTYSTNVFYDSEGGTTLKLQFLLVLAIVNSVKEVEI